VAQHFARGVPPIALWARIPLRDRPAEEPPELEGAVAWLRCALRAEHETGDHTFFVAEVAEAELAPGDPQPLVLHRQSYASL
jgi:flavin reductase (DIM6/NTAB) family NADH-FMN oxidoreductase RutF